MTEKKLTRAAVEMMAGHTINSIEAAISAANHGTVNEVLKYLKMARLELTAIIAVEEVEEAIQD